MIHPQHTDLMARLKRIEGHLRTVMAMVQEDRGCAEIAQQLHAVEKAMSSAKRSMIHAHIGHCLEGAARDREDNRADLIAEFKEIAKYL